jgi:hypothetical protein
MAESDFSLRVVRSDDMLVLTFEFFNLVLDPNVTAPRRLIRRVAGQEARIVVHFPPQHILEEAFSADVGPPTEVRSIPSRISGTTRLAFRVPNTLQPIPLTLAGLLDWSLLEPVLIGLAAGAQTSAAPREPAINETAVELPTRLTLSPMVGAQWEHRPAAFDSAGVVELWHTSHTPGTGVSPEFRLRAIWTPDLTSASDAFTTSLNSAMRTQIVRLSSDLRHLDKANFRGLSAAEEQQLAELRAKRISDLYGAELRLSSLGGSLRVRSNFFFPIVPSSLRNKSTLPQEQWRFSLQDWSHHVATGRDQYARTVIRGFLYPFGHAATVVTITERKMYAGASGVNRGGFLIQRQQIFVQEPDRTYPSGTVASRAIPFAAIRVTDATIVTDVVDPTKPHVPKVGQMPFAFSLTATDKVGETHQFSTPLVFVPQDRAWDTGTIADLYAPHSRIDFASQPIAFAIPTAGVAEEMATTLRTLEMTIKAQIVDGAPAPRMTEATVGVPAVEQLMGAAADAVKIKLNEKYVKEGIEAANNVYADMLVELAANLPATSAGGLANPNLAMTALSQTQGAFPDVKRMRPEDIAKAFEGELLGVVKLTTILDMLDLKGLPEIKPEPGQKMSFTWTPKLTSNLPPLMEKEPTGTPKLTLSGSITAPAAGGHVNVQGTLEHIALKFMGVLRIGFTALRFTMESGKDPDFDPTIRKINFEGQLKFIEELQDSLLKLYGGSGPIIDVTPRGVSAGVAIALPMIPLGPLILSNLALSAKLNVFFTGEATSITFGLSSQEDPFLITYTIFGGGGYFSFTADTKGEINFTALLEFGGALAIDIGVARGAVQAMVGIGFEKADATWTLWGQVRVYGLLEVLEVVTISVEFHLSLAYSETPPDRKPVAIGRASLTVMVRVLAFSTSVVLEVERTFTAKDRPPSLLADPIPLAEWREYCESFAAV